MSFTNMHRTVIAVSVGAVLITFILSLMTRSAWPLTLFAVSFCWFVFLLFFLRNPARNVVSDRNRIISPCDGTIVEISKPAAGYTRVQIFLSLFDVHIFRYPVSGTVKKIEYKKGNFRNAVNKDAVKENESNRIDIELGKSETVSVTQVAGLIARRIICEAPLNSAVSQGEIYGMITLGSSCIIDFPDRFLPGVEKGQKVRAGISSIAVSINE